MIKKISILLFSFFVLTANIHAATQPKFTFSPLTPTKFPIALDEELTVQYEVTNQTARSRTLTVVPIQGVTQIVSGGSACANPFVLAPSSSCFLTLSISGSAIPAKITNGPEVCATNGQGNNTPDPFLCSRPSKLDNLNITRIPTKRPRLFIEPSTLTLIPHGESKSFTITNSSTLLTARNIVANLTGTVLDGNVTQDATSCVSVAPGKTCTLTFTALEHAVSLTSFPIKGENTKTVGGSIEVVSDTTATLSVSGSPLILDPNQIGTMIVTNNSPTIDAAGVQAAGLPSGITQDASDCTTTPIPHNGGTCTLSFTAGPAGVNETTIQISGTNTSLVGATVAVNSPTLLDIAFVGSSLITLQANETDTGTMTIQNVSNDVIPAGVTAHFASTALNGFVTASVCGQIPVGGTCTITFSAEDTSVAATEFPIYLDYSTTSIIGTITINSVPEAYLTSANANSLNQCLIDQTTNNLTSCQTFSSLGLNNPRGIALNPEKTRGYIVNNGNATVTKCDINQANFNLINCVDAQANGLSSPVGIALDPTGTYAYVTNVGNTTVSKCTIQGDGRLASSCVNSGATGLNYPNGITIKSTNDYAYITGGSSSKMYQCAIVSGGNLSGCLSVAPGYGDQSTGIAINTVRNTIYEVGYASGDKHTHLYNCTLVNGGGVTNCRNGTDAGYTNPRGMIAVNSSGTIAYITTTDASSYLQCVVGSDGYITSLCTSVALTPGYNWGIALIE